MKRIILLTILVCISVLYGTAQIKKVRVAPAYVAAKLVEAVNPDDYKEICTFYGYEPISSPNGENAFTDNKGSKAFWIDSLTQEGDSIRELKFFTNQPLAEIEKAFQSCGYTKTNSPKVDKPSVNGVRYEKRTKFSNRSKVCIIKPGPPNTLFLISKH